MNNKLIEYVMNNVVSICIVALNQQQANYVKVDTKVILFYMGKMHHIIHQNPNYIRFENGSRIDFVSNEQPNNVRGKRYNLLLFNTNVYERNQVFYMISEKVGILSY